MKCECEQLPQIFNVEKYPRQFVERLEIIDRKVEEWTKLGKCVSCGQHWQVDEWDKYQNVCAIKIFAPDRWQTFDDKPFRFQFLIDSRNGLSEEKCIKAECKNKALKSLVYCPAHAYEIGVRE